MPRVLLCLLLLAACSKPARPPIEDLGGRENLSAFKLGAMRGIRAGDRLNVKATFSDGTASQLVVSMTFLIAPNTTLRSGSWSWTRNGNVLEGTVAEQSVTFLGGQSGRPSIGGRFDLLNAAGTPLYRITIPTMEVAK